MFKHILIPTDGSPTADKAVRAGIDYAREAKARVTLFTVVPDYRTARARAPESRPRLSAEEYVRRCERKAAQVLRSALERARAAGVACDTDYAQDDEPYRAIVHAAEGHECDAIFMASHKRGWLGQLWYGSQTQRVLTGSRVPTMVYR
jgi:nucleotide-binding universal stress UspA family protein